jgi:hypothetical protein
MTMTQSRRHNSITVSAALWAVLTVFCQSHAVAQRPVPRADTLSAKVRDSLIAAVLADTLDAEVDTAMLDRVAAAPLRQSFILRPTFRQYKIGEIDAQEQASYATYVLRWPRATVRLDMTPVAFTGDTSLSSRSRPQVSFIGMSPINLRLDVAMRRRDTLRVFAQSMSFPGALTNIDAQALGAVGTSTVDLDAGSLGIAARFGARYTVRQLIGEEGVSLLVRGGVEYDPKPTGPDAVSWRGTTIRASVGLNRVRDNSTIGASAEVTRSFADSLGGRNLFPGGGSLTIEARGLRYLGEDGDGLISLNAFYSQPIGIERPDQPTRLIPVGNFIGVTGTGSFPFGAFFLLPTLSVLREASSATAVATNNVRTLLSASGYSTSASLGLSIPLGKLVTVTPEVGGVFGSVGQTVTSSFPTRFGRPLQRTQGFSDAIRGGWVSLELSLSR